MVTPPIMLHLSIREPDMLAVAPTPTPATTRPPTHHQTSPGPSRPPSHSCQFADPTIKLALAGCASAHFNIQGDYRVFQERYGPAEQGWIPH